jgi:hypothetical protein
VAISVRRPLISAATDSGIISAERLAPVLVGRERHHRHCQHTERDLAVGGHPRLPCVRLVAAGFMGRGAQEQPARRLSDDWRYLPCFRESCAL